MLWPQCEKHAGEPGPARQKMAAKYLIPEGFGVPLRGLFVVSFQG